MSVKTILVAHQSAAVRGRFGAALADARQLYLAAGTEPALREAVTDERNRVSLVLVDLGLARTGDPVQLVAEVLRGPRAVPVVVFAGSVSSTDQIAALNEHGVSGFVNEHADPQEILPALAPHLFPNNFNRRASPRLAVSVPISFRAGQTIAAATTRDVGRGGVGIQTMEPLPVGTKMQVTFKAPGGGNEVSASGCVVWSDSRVGMGARFDKLSPEAQRLLDEIVNGR